MQMSDCMWCMKTRSFLFYQFKSSSINSDLSILLLVNQLYQSFNESKFTLGIFIDLSKAFDTVDHKILTKKLELYGIKGCNLRWFKSYLSNRKQFITYGDKQTNIESITCRVPQNSILRPLLFIIFVNDLHKVTKYLDPLMFVEDTKCRRYNNVDDTIMSTIQ